MKNSPILKVPTLAVSAKQKSSLLNLGNIRTMSVHARCTYDGSAASALRLNVFLSPDGDNWDTLPYTYFDLTVTQSVAVQKSQIILSPEEGYVCFEVENLDGAYTITNVSVWVTVKMWPDN